jgi:hypothetical protein
MMQHVLDVDRVDEVDYLAGDEPYKREWMSTRRERRGVVAFNPHSICALADAARHFGARAWRSTFNASSGGLHDR